MGIMEETRASIEWLPCLICSDHQCRGCPWYFGIHLAAGMASAAVPDDEDETSPRPSGKRPPAAGPSFEIERWESDDVPLRY